MSRSLSFVALSLVAASCATTESATRPSTAGDDPAELQAKIFAGPFEGDGFCLVTPAVPETAGLTQYCVAKSGDVNIKYTNDPSTGEETIRFALKNASITYDDSSDKVRTDGKFTITIDRVYTVEGDVSRERAPTVGDQLIFNNWRDWVNDKDNVKVFEPKDL